MLITINLDDPRPIYQQIVDAVKSLIASGELPEGASLPPVRQVAADLGVNLKRCRGYQLREVPTIRTRGRNLENRSAQEGGRVAHSITHGVDSARPRRLT